MSIVLDAVSYGAANATSVTYAHTVSGSDTLIDTSAYTNTLAATGISGITYNSVAYTRITGEDIDGSRGVEEWYLIAPSDGTNNVVVTWNSSNNHNSVSSSWTGMKQSDQPDAFNSNSTTSGTSMSTTVTTVADNSRLVGMAVGLSGSLVAGTDTTINTSVGIPEVRNMYGDANVTPAGGQAIAFTAASSILAIIAASFAPAVAAGPANLKSKDGLVKASIKSMNGLVIASVKSVNGLE